MNRRFLLWAVLECFTAVTGAATTPVLRLQDVLESVERSYPQIKVAQLEIAKATGGFVRASGKFDPSLDANTRSQPLGGYINNYGDTQLNVPTLYNGVKLFAGYRNGQGDWPIYYQNYLTNSGGEYRAGLSLPLLRDRRIDRERGDLLASSESIGMKHYEADAVKIRIYHESINAYWQWVEAGLQLRTFKELLQLAKTRQKAIEKQALQGDLARLAITENLQQIMQREQLLNQGRMMFEQASVNLSLYYRDRRGHALIPDEHRLPQDVYPQTVMLPPVSLREHPAMKTLQKQAKIVRIRRDQAHNELLPQLNAEAYAFKQYGSGGYPLLLPQAAMVGFWFKFPLLQREAKGKLIRAESELQQVNIENRFLHDRLKNELSNLFIGIHRLRQQVDLLKREFEYALKVQQGESQKFENGDSTLFLVNQREQLTTQVKLNWINARVQLEALKDRVRYFASTVTAGEVKTASRARQPRKKSSSNVAASV